jgi:nucleoside-diphosphate-sugar epimerase
VILLTGAAGFLGRAVAAQLRRSRIEYLGTDLHSADLACDITDQAAVARLFETRRVDAVIHLAGLLATTCRSNPWEATRVNIGGSANLLEASATHGVQRFVFGSSFSVYAQGDIYGAAKRYVELYGEALARQGKLPFVALRIATVVGPGARNTASPWRSEIFEKLGTGVRQRISLPFAADAVLSLLHVDDAAGMLIQLATGPAPPACVCDSPAENWSARKLKEVIEGIDANVTLDLEPVAPPASTAGNRPELIHDFLYQPNSLARHLAQAAG